MCLRVLTKCQMGISQGKMAIALPVWELRSNALGIPLPGLRQETSPSSCLGMLIPHSFASHHHVTAMLPLSFCPFPAIPLPTPPRSLFSFSFVRLMGRRSFSQEPIFPTDNSLPKLMLNDECRRVNAL